MRYYRGVVIPDNRLVGKEVLEQVPGLTQSNLSQYAVKGYIGEDLGHYRGFFVYTKNDVNVIKKAWALIKEGYRPQVAFEKARRKQTNKPREPIEISYHKEMQKDFQKLRQAIDDFAKKYNL